MRRTRSGAFRPYRMELLALYLTAAHGVYPRGGGALDNDDPVATWTDVRTGRSVSNATEAQQPLWKADSGLSTRPGLLFDGTDDILFTTTTPSVSDKRLIGVCGTIGTIGDYDDFAAASISTTSTDFIVWRPHYTSAAPNPSVFFDKLDCPVTTDAKEQATRLPLRRRSTCATPTGRHGRFGGMNLLRSKLP